jgi:hypothetical protein
MSSKIFKRLAIVMILVMLLALAGCGGSPSAANYGGSISTSIPGGVATAPSGGNPASGGATAHTANVAPGGIDPCTLLTRANAEGILGKSVGEANHPITASATFEVSSCQYKIVGGSPLDNATLIYTFASSGDTSTVKTAFDTGRSSAQKSWNAAPVDVPGLGDEAYWVGGAGNNISVLKGATYITLSASSNKGDTPPAAILDLAKVVLSRLH